MFCYHFSMLFIIIGKKLINIYIAWEFASYLLQYYKLKP